ncbi:hypothetical protein [Accumulibacter sp.]|nr:hypothetical protein [Accumulibacter sp.]
MAIDTSWANVSLLCPFSVDAQDVKGKVRHRGVGVHRCELAG